MTSRLNPYLNFSGTAREALEFYQGVFGGDVQIMSFGDMPGGDPAWNELVMHGQLETPEGYTMMISDVPEGMGVEPTPNGLISLSGDDEATLRGYWDGLSQGGQVDMALEPQMWGDTFGQLTDRFGVPWCVNIAGSGVAGSEGSDTQG